MSMFLPEKTGEKPDSKGPESYLSADERKALQRSLSFPEDLPPRFKSWILDHVVQNIQDLPVSQLAGYSQRRTTALDTVSTANLTLSTAEQDIPGCAVTISVSRSIFVFVAAMFDWNSSVLGWNTVRGLVDVNGGNIASFGIMNESGLGATARRQLGGGTIEGLDAGDFTIKLQAVKDVGAGTIVAGLDHTRMSVLVMDAKAS